jgi:hypothetical protein
VKELNREKRRQPSWLAGFFSKQIPQRGPNNKQSNSLSYQLNAPLKSVTVKSASSRLGSLVFFLNRYRSGGQIINNQTSTHIECMPGKPPLLTSRFLFKEREKITV